MGSVQQESSKKTEARLLLENVEMADTKVECKLIERQQWSDLAVSITAAMGGERVQTSGSKDKMGNAIDRCIDMEAEIDSQVEKLVREKKKATEVLERLDSPYEYKLLHMRYIQYIKLKDIAAAWDEEYTNITTAHGRALAHVQAILDRKEIV